MLSFKSLKDNILSQKNLLEEFKYNGESIAITKDFEVCINGTTLGDSFESVLEAKQVAVDYIDSIQNDSVISENLIVNIIEKHYTQIKITQNLLEAYKQTLSTKEFSIDPVVKELKEYDTFGKYEFILNDGNRVSISEELHSTLHVLLNNKYEIIEYMKESIDNFKSVLRQIRY